VVTFDNGGNIISNEIFENNFIEIVAGLSFAPCDIPNTIIIQLLTAQGKSQIISYTISPSTSASGSATVTTAPSTSTVHTDEIAASAETPTDEELSRNGSTWLSVLAEMKQDFMAEHDIPSASVRCYGMAVSPFGGTTAIAASFHPKDSPEYITINNEKTIIMFGTVEGTIKSPSHRGFFWKRFYDNNIPDPFTVATEAVLLECVAQGNTLISTIRSSVEAAKASISPNSPISVDVVADLITPVLQSQALNALRYETILQLIPPKDHNIRENPHIIAAIITAALSSHVPSLTTTSTSKRLLYSLACVGIMGLYTSPQILQLAKTTFQWLGAHMPEETRFDREMSIIRMREGNSGTEVAVEECNVARESIGSEFVGSVEHCEVCGNGMVWGDLRIAECTQGHRFSRCALTWLPIVEPRNTKECGVCGRTVLSRLGGKKGDADIEDCDGNHKNCRAEFAQMVFDAWEVCLQCGGRYWSEEN
jgi:hypothetical protein